MMAFHPLIALAVGSVAKAYPLAILTRHEIANDEINGMPVTFCPLCNAAIVHPFLYLGKLDRRDPATARVLGYFSNKTAIAYPLTTIAKAGMIEDRLDGQSVV